MGGGGSEATTKFVCVKSAPILRHGSCISFFLFPEGKFLIWWVGGWVGGPRSQDPPPPTPQVDILGPKSRCWGGVPCCPPPCEPDKGAAKQGQSGGMEGGVGG